MTETGKRLLCRLWLGRGGRRRVSVWCMVPRGALSPAHYECALHGRPPASCVVVMTQAAPCATGPPWPSLRAPPRLETTRPGRHESSKIPLHTCEALAWPEGGRKGPIAISPARSKVEARFVQLNGAQLRKAIDRLGGHLHQSGVSRPGAKGRYRALRNIFLADDPGTLSVFNFRLTCFLLEHRLGYVPNSVLASTLLERSVLGLAPGACRSAPVPRLRAPQLGAGVATAAPPGRLATLSVARRRRSWSLRLAGSRDALPHVRTYVCSEVGWGSAHLGLGVRSGAVCSSRATELA